MKTYTLEQFIKNVENRKNMKRNDKVVITFDELNQKKKTKNEELFNYILDNKNYDLYVINSSDNSFIVSVIINNVEFEIGQIIDKTTEPQTYIARLDCDVYFY